MVVFGVDQKLTRSQLLASPSYQMMEASMTHPSLNVAIGVGENVMTDATETTQ
jgi:hypothetical protein